MGRRSSKPKTFKSIVIHPELHKRLSHDAIDNDRELWAQIHEVLSLALGRDDLIDSESNQPQTCKA